MKVTYHFNSFNERKMLTAVGNLMGNYYSEVSVKLREAMEKVQQESRVRDWVVAQLRKGKGSFGTAVDTSFSSMEAVLAQGDMFWFEVDGVRLTDLFKGKKELDLVVGLNDYYLVTQLAMRNFYGKLSLSKYPKTLEGEREKWLDWFEYHLRRDRDVCNPDFTRVSVKE
jgi:hypothetical protein